MKNSWKMKQKTKRSINRRPNWKQAAALLCGLALASGLWGCGSSRKEEAQIQGESGESMGGQGVFRESDVSLPGNVDSIKAVQEISGEIWMVTKQTSASEDTGSLIALWKCSGESLTGENSGVRTQEGSDSEAGTFWSRMDGSFAELPAVCDTAAISQEGSFALFTQEGDLEIWRLGETEDVIAPERISLSQAAEAYTAAFIDEETLLVTDTETNIRIIDLTEGRVSAEISGEGETHYLTVPMESTIVTVTKDGAKIYSLEGEKLEENQVVSQLFARQNSYLGGSNKGALLAADRDGTGFYYAESGGMYHYTGGGSVTEQLFEGSGNSMGSTDSNFRAMAVLSDSRFLIAYQTGSGAELKLYGISQSREAEDEDGLSGELKVYILQENALLEQEINTICRSHPGLSVTLEVGTEGENTGMTAEDAQKVLNTEILAGVGPDVMLLDGLSVEKYGSSGMLTDLSALLEELTQEESFYENITGTFVREDGAVYGIPARFRIPVMLGDQQVLEGIRDLASLVETVRSLKEENPGLPSVVGYYDEALLSYLFDFCASAWTDGDSGLDEAGLREFLEAAKEIQEIQKEGVDEQTIRELADREDCQYGYADEELSKYFDIILFQEEAMSFYLSKSLNFTSGLLDFQEDYPSLVLESARGQSSNVFLPREILGINAKSDKGELAAAFIKEMLSLDVQISFTLEDTAYPVNRQAFENMGQSVLDQLQSGAEESPDGAAASVEGDSEAGQTAGPDPVDAQVERYRAGFARMDEMAAGLEVCGVTDSTIRSVVITQAQSYLSGETSLEDSVTAILQRINLYLAE